MVRRYMIMANKGLFQTFIGKMLPKATALNKEAQSRTL